MTFVEMKRCMQNHFKEMTDDAEVLSSFSKKTPTSQVGDELRPQLNKCT